MSGCDIFTPKKQVLCRLGEFVLHPVNGPLKDFSEAERSPWALPGKRIVHMNTLRKIARENKMDVMFFWTAEGGLL